MHLQCHGMWTTIILGPRSTHARVKVYIWYINFVWLSYSPARCEYLGTLTAVTLDCMCSIGLSIHSWPTTLISIAVLISRRTDGDCVCVGDWRQSSGFYQSVGFQGSRECSLGECDSDVSMVLWYYGIATAITVAD